MVAFKGMFDYYVDGVEFEKVKEHSTCSNLLKTVIKRLKASGILISIVFKSKPTQIV